MLCTDIHADKHKHKIIFPKHFLKKGDKERRMGRRRERRKRRRGTHEEAIACYGTRG